MMGAKEEYEARKRLVQAKVEAKAREEADRRHVEAEEVRNREEVAAQDLLAEQARQEADSHAMQLWFRQRSPIDRLTGWLGVWTALLFLATIFNAIVLHLTDEKIGQQVKASGEQIKVMQGQLHSMEDDRRPWLRIEVEPGDFSSYLPSDKLPYPVVHFDPQFKITNVGKSPAFNAQLLLSGYAIAPGQADPYAGQKEVCDRQRAQPLDNPARGHALFPGDFFGEAMSIGKYTVAFMGPSTERLFTKQKDGTLSLTFYVIGCVSYVFGSPPKQHQTGFVYEVWRMINDPAEAVDNKFVVGQSTDKKSIRLIRGPSSSLAD